MTKEETKIEATTPVKKNYEIEFDGNSEIIEAESLEAALDAAVEMACADSEYERPVHERASAREVDDDGDPLPGGKFAETRIVQVTCYRRAGGR